MNPRLLLLAALLGAPSLHAVLPDAIPYQGRIAANGSAFTGTGQFKFAIYSQDAGNPASAALLWTSATGPTSGAVAEPATAIALPVTNGLFALGLGDTAVPGMANLSIALAPAYTKPVFVRVWFNDGIHGFQQLSPDTELHAVPFAREASSAASIAGLPASSLARVDWFNVFSHVNGLTVQGAGPSGGISGPGATVPVTGAGSRMEFLPGLGAFRAGSVSGDQWDPGKIGLNSTALGTNTTASGTSSTALGNNTTASGWYSSALGSNATANGIASLALGSGTTANGWNSTALGLGSVADGYAATTLGQGTSAASQAETALGAYNSLYTPSAPTSWAPSDRLLVVGNGTDSGNRHDALVMLKNGATTLNGSLRLNDVNGLLVHGTGPIDTTPAPGSTVPVSGPGTRLFFIPGLSALRAGTAYEDEWDQANIGVGSVALGTATLASGHYSTALGTAATASGYYSTALGGHTKASGTSAIAIGNHAKAEGQLSLALGLSTTASGYLSTAWGNNTTARGAYSTAGGAYTIAVSDYETVLGCYNTTYTPSSTFGWSGSDRLLVVGNGTADHIRSDAFIIWKNGNAWLKGTLTQGSDRNRKTDIVPADTAAVLTKVAALPLATWKYKDETVTHLGPMAQDFFAAFQLGGTETGIASVDADGVALAAIQELAKQNTALKTEVAELKARLAALEAKFAP